MSPREQQSPVFKSNTALYAQQLSSSQTLKPHFRRYCSSSRQIQVQRDFQRQLFGHLSICIHQDLKLLWHFAEVSCCAAEAATFPGSLDKCCPGTVIWSWLRLFHITQDTSAWHIQASSLSGEGRCSRCFAEPSEVPARRPEQHLLFAQDHEKVQEPKLEEGSVWWQCPCWDKSVPSTSKISFTEEAEPLQAHRGKQQSRDKGRAALNTSEACCKEGGGEVHGQHHSRNKGHLRGTQHLLPALLSPVQELPHGDTAPGQAGTREAGR